MESFIKVLNKKGISIGLLVIAVIADMMYRGSSNIWESIGYLAFEILVVWLIGIGFILILILHVVYNLIKPQNTVKIEFWSRLNLSIILGVVVSVVYRIIQNA